jgi:hypothetical protein
LFGSEWYGLILKTVFFFFSKVSKMKFHSFFRKSTILLLLNLFILLIRSDGGIFNGWGKQSRFGSGRNSWKYNFERENSIFGSEYSPVVSQLVKEIVSQAFSAGLIYFLGKSLYDHVVKTTIASRSEEVDILRKFPEYEAYFHSNCTLNEYEMDILSTSTIIPSSLSKDWSELGGLTEVKKNLVQIISALNISARSSPSSSSANDLFQPSFPMLKIKPVKSILFYGPPGNGKTALILGMAKKLQWPIISITPSTLLRKYVGDTSLLTKAVFSLAKKLSPCIIFVDEMDSLFRARSNLEQHFDRNLLTECKNCIYLFT